MNVLVIGGAGFIGSNVAAHYLARGDAVTVLDNLSRPGTAGNLQRLRAEYPRVRFLQGDIRWDQGLLKEAVAGQDVVFHLAAQVAVTTSVADPRTDFEVNALGSFNVLEAVRQRGEDPILFYASTNKVYGGMEDLGIVERDGRYAYAGVPHGVGEDRPMDFHSPYGCSKGSADQYVRDYARIYGLRTVVFRQSCIYGDRQMGNEDQGWVAWFAWAALTGQPITIYGDGKQVRDVLYVGDLLRAYDLAMEHIETARGQVYNIGGGPAHTLSLLELIERLGSLLGLSIPLTFSEWRPGDQRVYISDIRKAHRDFQWAPRTDVSQGTLRLVDWLKANRDLVKGAVQL